MSLDLSQDASYLATNYKPTNVETLLIGIGNVMQQYLVDVIAQFDQRSNIDTATGIWLDYVGYRYGILSRPPLPSSPDVYFGFSGSDGTGFDQAAFVPDSEDTIGLSDDDFRRFIKAKAQQLIGNCTPENIRDALLLFFDVPSDVVLVVDNQDMSMNVNIVTDKNLNVVNSVIDAGIVMKPAAVLINYTITPGEYFGFAGSNGTGFDQEAFIA